MISSGACPATTSAPCLKCSTSKARRPACRGRPSSTSYRAAFDGWDPEKIAAYDEAKVAELLANPGIVRNRLKVAAAISNAKAYLRLRDEGGTLDAWLWSFVDGKQLVNRFTRETRPAKTELAERISKELAKRGFKFVGPTIVYAYMQGIGMVDDHDVSCFCHGRAAS